MSQEPRLSHETPTADVKNTQTSVHSRLAPSIDMPGSSSIPVRSYHGIGVALAPDEEIQEIREQEQPKGTDTVSEPPRTAQSKTGSESTSSLEERIAAFEAHARMTTGGTQSTAPTTASTGMTRPLPSSTLASGTAPPPPVPAAAFATWSSTSADWAPSDQKPVQPPPGTAPQLPAFFGPSAATAQGAHIKTSFNLPPSETVAEMEESTAALLSEKVFAQLLQEPLARHRFREFLHRAAGDVVALDLYTDVAAFQAQSEKARTTATALHDLLLSSRGGGGCVSTEASEELMRSLRHGMEVGLSLTRTMDELLKSLYTDFMAFIRNKLIEEAVVVLGQLELPETLAQCYCLTNPRLFDDPIVLVSEGFERLTGYTAAFVVGRNCRMLAGPATSSLSSRRIREALSRGDAISLLLMNYRRSGVPFWNLLNILPLRDSNGRLVYFLGCQTEVTGAVATSHSLKWLVGCLEDPTGEIDPSEQYSPTLRAYAAGLTTGSAMGIAPPQSQPSLGHVPAPASFAGVSARENPYLGSDRTSGQGKRKNGFWKTFLANLSGRHDAAHRDSAVQRSLTRRREAERQQIGGAETLLSGAARRARPVDLQLAQFESLYSKLLVFRKETREILFVTPDLIAFCGHPCTSLSDKYNSPLLHLDVLDILTLPKHADQKRMRQALKQAIDYGTAISLECGIRARSVPSGDPVIKQVVLHVTPLHDRDQVAHAFVAVFG